MKAPSYNLCPFVLSLVTYTVLFGVATVCFKGRRLGFVEFLLRLNVIDWLSSAALSLSLLLECGH